MWVTADEEEASRLGSWSRGGDRVPFLSEEASRTGLIDSVDSCCVAEFARRHRYVVPAVPRMPLVFYELVQIVSRITVVIYSLYN